MKVMLVDDDENIRMMVQYVMENDKYEFCCASEGKEALKMLKKEKPDLLILDVMLPGMNGFDLCKTIREDKSEKSRIPIIFLSAKSDLVDKSIGFRAGGDDYLAKPFAPLELSLRVEALLRRTLGDKEENEEAVSESAVFGDMEIFFRKYEVRMKGKKVNLTSKEFEILAYLARKPGMVFTREQILEHIWGKYADSDANNITVFIRKIREKIEEDPARPKYIQTVWRVGYKFYE